jgi:hypothetical protein
MHTSLSAFIDALGADASHPDIPEEARLFEPLFGSWDLDVTWYGPSGEVLRRLPGEWHFAPVLEGRAVEDVWIVPSRAARATTGEPAYEYGTSLRFYDPSLGAWRSTWIGPCRGAVNAFVARRAAAGGIVLDAVKGSGPEMRWSFSDIAADGFRWHNHLMDDGSWRLVQDFVARRAAC